MMTYGHHYRQRMLADVQAPVAEPEYFHDQQMAPMRGRDQVSVRNLTVPLLLVLSGAVTVVVATYIITSNMIEIKYSIRDIQTQLQRFADETKDRIGRVETDIAKMKATRWTISNHELWCSREERLNPGWKCVSVSDPGLNGSQPQRDDPAWGPRLAPSD